MPFGKKKKAGFSTSVASAKTNEAALNAMIRDNEASDDEQTRIRNNVYKMIDQGTGTIVDLWAPPRMKILSDYIELGDEALSICTVSNWPTSLSYGWLNQLLEDPSLADVKIDVSMHIHPIRKEYAIQYMQDKKISAESSKLAEQERGKNKSTDLQVYDSQIDTAQMVYDLLQNEDENLYQVSLTFGVYGHEVIDTDENGERHVIKDAKEDVIEKMDRFKRALAKNSGGGFAIKPLLHQQRDGIKSLLPWGYGGLHSFQNMYTSALATCFPFTHGELQVEDGILYGINPWTQQTYFFNGFDRNWVKSYSSAIIGSTGSGKSATVKTLLGRYAIRGTQIFIIDPAANTQGEYVNLATSLDGVVIDFGGRSGIYMNPFELIPPANWVRGMKTDQKVAEETYRTKKDYLVGLFDLMRNKYVQENQVTSSNLETFSKIMGIMIDRLYQYKGLNIAHGTWDFGQWTKSRMPTMSDFYDLLKEYITIVKTYTDRDKVMSWGADHLDARGHVRRVNSAADRIMYNYYRNVRSNLQNVWGTSELRVLTFTLNFVEEYAAKQGDESYSEKAALFSGKRQADLSSNCIVFRFGNVSETVKDIATYLTFELIYSRINSVHDASDKYTHYIVAMDECWKMLSTKYARDYVVKLEREGRKLNTGLWVISQKWSDFNGDNKVLLDQAEVKIILSQPGEEVDAMSDELELSPTLASVINSDKSNTMPGLGLLHIGGVRHSTVAFYCVMSKMEMAIADTSDSKTPALTPEQIHDFVN